MAGSDRPSSANPANFPWMTSDEQWAEIRSRPRSTDRRPPITMAKAKEISDSLSKEARERIKVEARERAAAIMARFEERH